MRQFLIAALFTTMCATNILAADRYQIFPYTYDFIQSQIRATAYIFDTSNGTLSLCQGDYQFEDVRKGEPGAGPAGPRSLRCSLLAKPKSGAFPAAPGAFVMPLPAVNFKGIPISWFADPATGQITFCGGEAAQSPTTWFCQSTSAK